MIGGEDVIVRGLEAAFIALAPSIDEAPRTPGRKDAGGGTAEHGYLHSSRGGDDFADKVLSALRLGFGGHAEMGAAKTGDAS